MKTINKIVKIQEEIDTKKDVGLVPTMGFLHAGHLSLVKKALAENEIVVVSIFVNPAQFSPGEDYDEYPRDLEKDKQLLSELGVDYVFNPSAEEMYGETYRTYVEVKELTDNLCGSSRPNFFKGITTVVSKLFNIIQPERAYFGLKDFQQYVVIKKMVRDLNFPIEIRGVPTVREKDGLALSSRNRYLNSEERKKAVLLYKSLKRGEKLIIQGEKDAEKVKKVMIDMLRKEEIFKIDYISIVDPENLQHVDIINNNVLLAGAVDLNGTRLIDNVFIEKS